MPRRGPAADLSQPHLSSHQPVFQPRSHLKSLHFQPEQRRNRPRPPSSTLPRNAPELSLPFSRDPARSGSKIDELTASARALDSCHPPDRVKFVRSLIEESALCRGPGGRICEYNRSLQQSGVTGALEMRSLRLSCFIVFIQ